jgi:Flp pilus assembly secretin CpaC
MRALRPFVAAVVAACVFAVAPAASAREIRVALDQAFPLRMAQPVEGVAVGNPSIAAVSVQNDRFLFVTGRSYGTTSLTIIGANNSILYQGRIVVEPDETGTVIVNRGGDTSRLECSPICRARPDIGDGQSSQQVNEQITAHATTATGGSH